MSQANPITADDVKSAAAYLADGGLGEVMAGLHMSGANGFQVVQSDTAMLIALCSMAQAHIQNKSMKNPPVRMVFGEDYG